MKKIVFISWAPYCSRSDNIAREFNGKSYMVYFDFLGSNFVTIAFKYILQTIKSLWILYREKPEIVFIMTPPVIACLPAWIYCKFARSTGFIIDAHSAALIGSIWEKLPFINHFFAIRALTVIVTNEYLKGKCLKWDAKATIVADVPIQFMSSNDDVLQKKQKNIAVVVNSFGLDEPLGEVIKAADIINNEVDFSITGNVKDDKKGYSKQQFKNIKFTGFLSDDEYKKLLVRSSFVICLTTWDNTMQRGGYESIYCNTPLITSDWQILRDNFYLGTVFVKNTAESIKEGIEEILNNIEFYKEGALQLKKDKLNRWEKSKKNLQEVMNNINK